MRLTGRTVALCAIVFSTLLSLANAISWGSDDVEIFNVRHKLMKLEGYDIDFYKYIGVENGFSAMTEEISRAYRKKSLALHPDKRKKVVTLKQAQERFTLLGLVGDVLRTPHRRQRYDFFLKNGFPEWTGKDYLYSRFRPGLALTLAFLLFFISGMQYLFHSLTASRQRAHITRYIDEVKEIAWRPSGGQPPLSGAKKYVTLGDQSEEGEGRSRKFAVEFDGDVYFIDPETGAESLLDVGEIEGPSWRRTLLYYLPVLVWSNTIGRVLKKKNKIEALGEGNGSREGVKENGLASTGSKHVKAEKVAGKRKVKKRN